MGNRNREKDISNKIQSDNKRNKKIMIMPSEMKGGNDDNDDIKSNVDKA